VLEGKRILALGGKNFFHGIQDYLALRNQVVSCTPKNLLSLISHLALADLVWIEWGTRWCDPVGRLAPPAHVVCRAHRYEMFRPYRIAAPDSLSQMGARGRQVVEREHSMQTNNRRFLEKIPC